MKQTAVDYLFEQLLDTPKNNLMWGHILNKAKEMEESNLLLFGFKCFIKGVLSVIVGILIALFI
jgi:hypothetical protein